MTLFGKDKPKKDDNFVEIEEKYIRCPNCGFDLESVGTVTEEWNDDFILQCPNCKTLRMYNQGVSGCGLYLVRKLKPITSST
jgi:hypothetical protein